jgi:hypothetical protein
MSARIITLLVFLLLILGSNMAHAQQINSYRNVIQYPYHAAPYYSYPSTNGYGYQYSPPIVNAEYSNQHNDQETVVYPSGPYDYANYYKYGRTICFLKAHQLSCIY